MAIAEGGGGFAQPDRSATRRWSDGPPRRPTAGGHLAYATRRLRPPWPHVRRPIRMQRLRASSHGCKSQVPLMLASPNIDAKVPTCESQIITKIWFKLIKVGTSLFYAKIFVELGLRVGSSFLLDPTRNTSSISHLQKMMPCRHPCHTWDLGLGNHVKW